MENEKLTKLKSLFKLVDESLTKKDFEEKFSKILKFLTDLKAKFQVEISKLKESIVLLSKELKEENTTNISGLKDEFIKTVDKALKDQEDGLNFMRDKVRNLKEGTDGKDGKNGTIGKDGHDGKDGSPDTSFQIANKLETLKDETRLKISAIDKLQEELDELKNRPTGGGGTRKVVYTKRINLSSQCNGTLKEFTMPKDCIDVLAVYGTQFPITFDEADFTFEGRTLTLTSEVGAPQTGQTLFALIQTLFYGKI